MTNEVLEKIKNAHVCVDDATELMFWVWAEPFQQMLSLDNTLELMEICREWVAKSENDPGCISEEDDLIFKENEKQFKKEFVRNEENILTYSERVTPVSDNEAWQRLVRLAEHVLKAGISAKPQKWQMIKEG